MLHATFTLSIPRNSDRLSAIAPHSSLPNIYAMGAKLRDLLDVKDGSGSS